MRYYEAGTSSRFQSPFHRVKVCHILRLPVSSASGTFQSPFHRVKVCHAFKEAWAAIPKFVSIPFSSGQGLSPKLRYKDVFFWAEMFQSPFHRVKVCHKCQGHPDGHPPGRRFNPLFIGSRFVTMCFQALTTPMNDHVSDNLLKRNNKIVPIEDCFFTDFMPQSAKTQNNKTSHLFSPFFCSNEP